MSKYLLDKFLFTVDRDPELVERYREDPRGTVAWWEAEMANRSSTARPARRAPGWRSPTTSARRSSSRTTSALFEMGAHPFLTLTLFIAMFERDHDEPLEYQLAYGAARWSTSPCRTPTSRPDRCAPPSCTRPGPAVAGRAAGPGRRTGPDAGPGHRRAGRAARPAVRDRHVVLRGAGAAVRARRPGRRQVVRVRATRAGTRVWFFTSGRDAARRREPGRAAPCRTTTSCRWPTAVPDELAAALGLSGGRGLDGADLAGAAAARRAGAGARRRRGGRPGRRAAAAALGASAVSSRPAGADAPRAWRPRAAPPRPSTCPMSTV